MSHPQVHVDTTAIRDVFVPVALFPEGAQPGDLIALRPLEVGKGKARDRPLLFKIDRLDDTDPAAPETSAQGAQRVPIVPPAAARRSKISAVTVHPSVAQNFPWVKTRAEVTLELIHSPPPPHHVATYVELYFANVYLGRPDQFRLALHLVSSVLFVGQRVVLPGSGARLRVGAIYNKDRKKVRSAYVADDTRIVFRSESARCFVCVEVSKEMWHFEEDGSTLREKCEVFLTELFSQFYDHPPPTSHTVTIILYGRVLYEDNGEGELERAPLQRTGEGVLYRDFYKVLLDLTPSPPRSMARTVSSEIRGWERDVLLHTTDSGEQMLSGRIAFAHESNVLEATNLALNSFEEHWIDRDLQRTGLSLLVLTAGTSFYQVDKTLLRITTERMLFHGVGLDIISLSKAPLHTVPLFAFQSQEPGLSEEGAAHSSAGAFESTLSSSRSNLTTRESLTQEASRISGAFPDDQRDPLYYDAPPAAKETSEYFAEPLFVFCSFFGFQTDKPHRIDRFMPRARCYELFSQGIGQRMPIAIPLLPAGAELEKEESWSYLSEQEQRQARRDRYDAAAVGAKTDLADLSTWSRRSGATSGTSSDSRNRFGESRSDSIAVPAQAVPIQSRKRYVAPKRSAQSSTIHPAASRVASMAIPIVDRDADRGRQRAVSEMHLPSSTRSKTPVGRPRARSPSAGSTRTTRNTKTAMPALISRLTAAPSAHSSAAPTSTRSGWLGLFGGRSTTTAATAPAVSVQRVEAFSTKAPDLDLETVSSTLSERRSSRATSPSASSRRSSSISVMPPRPTPTQPISISNRAAPMRDADRVTKPTTISRKQHQTPGQEVASTGKSKGARSYGGRFNPSMPGKRSVGLADQARRWASIFIRHSNDQRAVNWVSITRGACLPITTDYLPTAEALSTQYSDFRYSISANSTFASFLLKTDNLRHSAVLELVTELISQRLGQGFQICTPANALGALDEINVASSKTIPDILRDIDDGDTSAVYLSLANQIHRISYDRRSHSVVVKILQRRSTWKKDNFHYSGLIWSRGGANYRHTDFVFPYPRLINPAEWQQLDTLVAGIEVIPDLHSLSRFWRTRLVLLPAQAVPDRDYLISKTAAFEGVEVTDDDINFQGFLTLMSTITGLRWAPPGTERDTPEVETTTLTAPEWAAEIGRKIQLAEEAQALPDTPHKTRWLPQMSRNVSYAAPPRENSTSSTSSANGPSRVTDQSPTLSPSAVAEHLAAPHRKPTVKMDHSIVLDLDPQKKSDRAERVLCHYDRSHNSSAAYHIELSWLAGSGKVIDSAIQSWTRIVSRWGLSLVEVSTRPVESRHNPFQQAIKVPLCVAPPAVEEDSGLYRHYYESALLTSLGFFLDVGADDTFPSNINVEYSYRRGYSDRSQYIHQSGTLLVCILGGKDGFAFVPNRIFISHSHAQTGAKEVVMALREACCDEAGLMKRWEDIKAALPASRSSPAKELSA